MNKPSRRTAIAAAVGGIALTATAVGAVAMTAGTPSSTPEPSVAQESAPVGTSQSQDGSVDDSAPATDGTTGDDGTTQDDGTTGDDGTTQARGVTREEAIEIAERALAEHGDVPPFDEIEREHEHGRAVWDVEFGDDHEVYVDIETGDVVRVDIDDDRDDRHDDDKDDRYDDDDHDDDKDEDRYDD